jgi:hypothetical protein
MRISKVAVEDEKLSVLKITLGWNQRIKKSGEKIQRKIS